MNQVPQWPVLDLATLLNMLVSAGIGLLAGFLGGWVGHLFSVQRDKQNRNWQELNYWRNGFERHLEEVQKIARVSLALYYVYGDEERDIAVYTIREKYAMRQARKANGAAPKSPKPAISPNDWRNTLWPSWPLPTILQCLSTIILPNAICVCSRYNRRYPAVSAVCKARKPSVRRAPTLLPCANKASRFGWP